MNTITQTDKVHTRLAQLLKSFIVTVAILLNIIPVHAADEDNSTATAAVRSTVFAPGQFGSNYYRIPAILKAKDGALVAIADKRWESMSDLPAKIDIVARRSTDGGYTWSNPVTIAAADSIGGFGDPAVVLNRKNGDIIVISTHGNGMWQSSPGQISVSISSDNGRTWAQAMNINPQILSDSLPETGKVDACSMFASSGGALQLKNGRIIFALVTRKPNVEGFPVYAVFSDDGGKTWRASNNPATLNGDEAKIVQLPDGTLIMSIRNRFQGNRIFSYSHDNGTSWSEPKEIATLPDPACNGDFMNVRYKGKNILLHTLPGKKNKREDVAVYASFDNGLTWPRKLTLIHGGGAYSAMTQINKNEIGFLIEKDPGDAKMGQSGYNIIFMAIPLNKIIGY